MAKSCAIIPLVRNSKGQTKDSKLFKDLLSFTSNNRAETVRVYLITKSLEFIQKWNPRLILDEFGEPTIKSLLDKTNLNTIIKESDVLERLNKDIGYYKKGTNRPSLHVNNKENYSEVMKKVIEFNTHSDFNDKYIALVIKVLDNESGKWYITPKISLKNKANSIGLLKEEYQFTLNEKLRKILESKGIAVGVLDAIEERQGINGVTEFDTARTTAEGLIEMIRLALGERGEKALPEEFAHFAIEAMSNNPLIERLINLIAKNNLASEIIGEEYSLYTELYKGDESLLAKEAAGKLLAKHLINQEVIPNKSYKTLLQRAIEAVKNFFKSFSTSDILKAMIEADRGFGNVAKGILNGSLDADISTRNIETKAKLFLVLDRVTRDKKLLLGIIDNELKRLKIYEKRNPNSTFSASQKMLIDRLDIELFLNNEIEGINVFISNALERLESLSRRLTVLENSTDSLAERAKVLRDVRNYLYSYKHISEDIRKALIEEERYLDNRYGERVRVSLNNMSNLLDDLYTRYTDISMPLFAEFLRPFLGDSIEVPFGKYKGKILKVEELIKRADDDISFFDRWLDSMADSSDYMLKLIDLAVKKSKELARLDTISISKLLLAATIKLELAGITDTEWMFEKDSSGNKTGRYISEINEALFKERVKELYTRLNEKYGRNPLGDDAQAYNRERREWFNANMEVVDGKKRPKMSIYASKLFASLNKALKEYYDTVIGIKSQLDSFLPTNYTTLTNAVKIRKDLLERVKSSEGVKSGTTQLWEAIKDLFIRRTDDTDFGDKATIKDFEGREVLTLPIYYTKLKDGENPNDISTDIVGTLTAYAAMANDFKLMNRVIDVLEVGRDILKDNLQITKTRGGKPLKEKFKSLGRTVESTVVKDSDSRRIIARLNDYFEMQVYGRYMADEGTFGKTNIDKGKVANFINRVTSLNMLGLNVLSGISNVATGKVMMRIESFSKEFFSEKDTLIADKNYGASLPEYLGEIGNRVKTSKLALWDELFNVMQEYETEVREVNFDRKTWFSRMFGTSALFMMNNAGEHWMLNRTSLALANAYKMKDRNGKIVSLWEAMEVVYKDPNNKKLGAELKIKEGYTKEDGSVFTNEDIISFSNKCKAINQRMHGIYNKIDRSAVQRLAVGRMAIMFRKWIKPSLNRRFAGTTYNYDLLSWTEGYYNTTGRFLWQIAKELKEGLFALMTNWDLLTNTEKANIRRAATEIGHFLILAVFLGLMDWPDKDDLTWLSSMVEYQARRLYTELGSMTPGPQMLSEGLRIVKSPSASINTLEGVLDLVGLMNPYNYETFAGEEALLKSGRYKGESRATKLFYQSPIIPMNKTIYKGLHPEEGIPFFKQ